MANDKPFIDFFIWAVPRERKTIYRGIAQTGGEAIRRCGCKKTTDCWGDDVPAGGHVSFPKAVDRSAEETVTFSWIHWYSRKNRQEGVERAAEFAKKLERDAARYELEPARIIAGSGELFLDI